MLPNNAINADVQKRRFALLLHAGYDERSVHRDLIRPRFSALRNLLRYKTFLITIAPSPSL
jgi:uncharacterized protein (DUF2336 family)